MDEAVAFVAIDISGRPYLKFDATPMREYVGDFPTEMLKHFFYTFVQNAGVTLHIKIEGENTEADLVVTSDVGRLYRAQSEGLVKPFAFDLVWTTF